MKSFIIASLLILFTVSLQGQSISHQVLLPAAGVVTEGDISYQQTVGETAVEIFVMYPQTLTQGFQQPLPEVEDDTDSSDNGIRVYPNPVTAKTYNKITVELNSDEARSYTIFIYNFTGSVLYVWRSGVKIDGCYKHIVDMDNYSRGIYVVRVMSTDTAIDLSFKIDKL